MSASMLELVHVSQSVSYTGGGGWLTNSAGGYPLVGRIYEKYNF